MKNYIKLNNSEVIEKKLSPVLDEQSITEINIDISDEDWKWIIENSLKEEYRKADITINGETFYNVGIRPKGNITLSSVASDETTDRYSFKVKFDEYVDNQSYNGMKSIVLNSNIQDTTYMKEYISYDLFKFMGVATPEMSYADISFNGEKWGLYLALEVVDERYLENNFGTSEGNLYKPETMGGKGGKGGGPGGMPPIPNGFDPENMPDGFNPGNMPDGFNPEDMKKGEGENKDNQKDGEMKGPGPDGQGGPEGFGGTFGNRNSQGADFKYIDDNVSSYSTVRDSAVLKRTTDSDFKKVINMFKNLNDGTNLEEVLDVEEVLKYFAINTYLTNFDGYSGGMYHNYYLYENNGKCQILPWDYNLSFGAFSMGGPGDFGGPGQKGEENKKSEGANRMINFPIDKAVTGDLENAPLIGKLLEVHEYKELYHQYLRQIAEEYFESGYYSNLVNKVDSMINEYVKNDPTALYGYERYTAAIPNMILWGEDRTKSVIAQLNGEQPSTEYGNIESKVDMDVLTEMGMGPKNKGDKGGEMIPQESMKQDEEVFQEPKNEETLKSDAEINKNKRDKGKFNGYLNNSQDEKETHYLGSLLKVDTQSLIVLGGCTILAIAGLIFVSKFKRRK